MKTFTKILKLNRTLIESLNFSQSHSSRSFAFHTNALKIQYGRNNLFSQNLAFLYLNRDSRRFAHNYKAAVLKEFGDELVIKELPRVLKLNENEVRIKVLRCAVNVADTLICSGKYDQEPKLPFIPGYEFSGEILEVGSKVKNLYVGDKIIGLNKDNYSAMATECISQERDLWKIPQDVSFDSAAALVDSYATVLIAARRANLSEQDTVLVTVAAGGLGLAAVDLAANLFNAKVIGACDTEDKANTLREKGAFSTVNYSKKELVKSVMKETNNKGVKIIFDAVGGEVFEDCLECISPEGSILVLGFSSRKIPQILTSQLLPKSCAIIGVSLTHYQKMINETYRNSVEEVINMYLDEFIDPHVAGHFKLKDVNDALKHVEDRKCVGKVLLDMS